MNYSTNAYATARVDELQEGADARRLAAARRPGGAGRLALVMAVMNKRDARDVAERRPTVAPKLARS
jgi:hypothetical protein